MYVNIQSFWLPKEGHSKEEYEDSFWYEPQHQPVNEHFYCAIADGASETSFSQFWAKLLSKYYCSSQRSNQAPLHFLQRIQKIWQQKVKTVPLPWYAEEKLQYGAFSTLTGLTIKKETNAWEAISMGDSCLFQIRNDDIITSIPYNNVNQFTMRPILLCSLPARNRNTIKTIKIYCGKWKRGDEFFLMTDALAFWFLNQAAVTAIKQLVNIKNQWEFENFVGHLRLKKHTNGSPYLRNDDVTFVRITM